MSDRPVALGFTEGLSALDELRMRVEAGHHDYAIMLGFGGLSSKVIHRGTGGSWRILNEIDASLQELTDEELWTESHIGIALDRRALLDMSGDPVLAIEGRGPTLASTLNAEAIDRAKAYREQRARERAEDPLTFRLSEAPGAIRMGEDADVEWEPANPSLTLEVCEIGPATVAQIDLAAVCMGFLDPARDGSEECRHAATTSIELTIEDIDALIETLTALREDAVANRGFALREDGFWTNGVE